MDEKGMMETKIKNQLSCRQERQPASGCIFNPCSVKDFTTPARETPSPNPLCVTLEITYDSERIFDCFGFGLPPGPGRRIKSQIDRQRGGPPWTNCKNYQFPC
jgi:hypothetical protein